jgi:hypothetical protein
MCGLRPSFETREHALLRMRLMLVAAFWETYRSLIGAAVFSAGAGGSAGVAPAFCASASGRAGSGEMSRGLLPVVAGSAGADGLLSAPGVDCSGCVACAIWAWRGVVNAASEITDMPNPVATITPASSISLL